MGDFADLDGARDPLRALRDAIRGGDVSARAATESALERAAQRADLGAFVTVTADRALAAADQADARWRSAAFDVAHAHGAHRALPPLHGVPLAHKDLVNVAGAPTTRGSAAFPHDTATADDPGVAQLHRSGAVSIGKTQVPEFGLTGYSENRIAAPARNPHDPRLTAGGSSGGSAAAVAAGILTAAPASDGGGSIRIPALACGLVGLKPGLGAIPTDVLRGRRDTFGAPKLGVSGPLARSARDAALLFDAMRADPTESTLAAVDASEQLERLSIGVSTATPFESASPTPFSAAALAALQEARRRLEARHRLDAAGFRYDPVYPELFTDVWTASLSLLEVRDTAAEELLMPLTRSFRERALARSGDQHRTAGARITRFAADVRAQWGAFDAVLMPGLAMDPPPVGAFLAREPDADYRLQCEWAPCTSIVNVSGLPAVAVPLLETPAGLSFGVQLVGRPGSEAVLLQLAAQLTEDPPLRYRPADSPSSSR